MASRKRPADLPDDLAAVPPVEPSDALRRRVLASVVETSRFEGFVERFARLFDLPEARAREVLGAARAVEGEAWVEAPIPGVRLCHFQGGRRVESADCGLVHLAPGTSFPSHRHRGAEWTLVLAGSAREDGGEVWRPGDLVVREADSVHGFRALDDEPYLFAVVLHGGIELTPS
jgi:anti-sigma factor ChrR (cupin superfamily)